MRQSLEDIKRIAEAMAFGRELRVHAAISRGWLAFVLVGMLACQALGTPPEQAGDGLRVHGKDDSQRELNRSTGFELTAAGTFDQLASELGTWKAITGKFAIDDKHAHEGKQCLWLPGPHTVVELEVNGGNSAGDVLSFAAERWTSRGPFTFRIETLSGATWTEVYSGDNQIRVGRSFLSKVKTSLGDAPATRLRLTVTSPPNTGVLIDEVRIAKPMPQRIVDVQVVPMTLPVLVGNDACPLVKLRIETIGSLRPIHLQALEAKLDGTTDISDVQTVHVVSTGQSETFASRDLVHATPAIKASLDTLAFSFSPPAFTLAEGTNFVWIACKLNPYANLDHRVGGSCTSLTFSNGQSFEMSAGPTVQRMGVALRSAGDDGAHTYRIPGLATTNDGALLAVYDVRYRNGADLPGDIDVGLSRSIDGGRTWEPMKIIMDMGNDPTNHYDGVGDPAILVDRNTGTIWVAGLWSHGKRAWNGSGPGIEPDETGQLLLVRSDDNGVTWSPPINITSQIKRPEWCLILQGPGKGITMRNGTLVFAAQYQDPPNNKRLPHSTIIYSVDQGKSWQVGTGAFADTTEAQVVESEPGVLMLNCRYNRAATRVVMTTRDMGRTWQKHPSSEHALIEPVACMASLVDVGRELDSDSAWMLFSNPHSTTARHRITIQASPDRGLTWPTQHHLLLDEGLGAGYTCMTMIDANTVGILYEGSQAHLTYQRIPLDDLFREPSGISRQP